MVYFNLKVLNWQVAIFLLKFKDTLNMTKRFKTSLFISMVVLFTVAAPLIIFYSFGWRFDWKHKKIIQTGIFYFKVWPKNVEIFINGKLEKKTDFLFGSAVVENLLAGNYELEIKKDNYHPWKKTLKVEEKMATEAKNIVLVPKNPKFLNLSNQVSDFYFLDNEKKIILKEEDVSPGSKETWALKIFDLKKNIKSRLIGAADFSKKEKTELINFQGSSDSKKILLKIGQKEKINYYLLPVDENPPVPTPLDFISQNADEVYFNPNNPQKILILENGTLKEAGLTSKEISAPKLKNIAAISFLNSDIYYLDDAGFIFKTDFSFTNGKRLNQSPFSLKSETDYKLLVSPDNVFLEENKTLYFLNDDKIFEKIFEPTEYFSFSPDYKKVFLANNFEIWIFFLENSNEQPKREKGEKILLTSFSEKIDDIFWWTNYYLIFRTGPKIKIAETDDRNKLNIVDLAEFPDSKIFWSKINKKLYVLSNGALFTSEEITP